MYWLVVSDRHLTGMLILIAWCGLVLMIGVEYLQPITIAVPRREVPAGRVHGALLNKIVRGHLPHTISPIAFSCLFEACRYVYR